MLIDFFNYMVMGAMLIVGLIFAAMIIFALLLIGRKVVDDRLDGVKIPTLVEYFIEVMVGVGAVITVASVLAFLGYIWILLM